MQPEIAFVPHLLREISSILVLNNQTIHIAHFLVTMLVGQSHMGQTVPCMNSKESHPQGKLIAEHNHGAAT